MYLNYMLIAVACIDFPGSIVFRLHHQNGPIKLFKIITIYNKNTKKKKREMFFENIFEMYFSTILQVRIFFFT